MGAPVTIAAGAIARRRLGPAALLAPLALLAVLLVLVIGVFGAIFGLQPLQAGYGPSATARAEIPARYLRLYMQAGQRYGIDPWVLAAIGSVESGHGRSRAPGVRSGVNGFGCCAGPMQFSIVGAPSAWERYGVDGNGDGQRSPYDPADAIPAAARYLAAAGAPADYRAALFAYNHADWYVADVLAKADQYRAAAPLADGGLGGDVENDRPVRGPAHPRVRDPHHVLHPGARELGGDREIAGLGHRVTALRPRVLQHEEVVGRDVEIG